MGSFVDGLAILVSELFSLLQLAVIVAIIMFSPARYFVDQLRLSLPWVGGLEREIAVHRFFRVLALLYGVSGHRVEWMIRTAAQTVSNHAARIDLSKAATAIEAQATIPEAFRRVTLLTAGEQASIEVGEVSGTLEKAFDRISDDTGGSMVSKLAYLQPILVRIVMVLVMASIALTMLRLLI